MAAGQIEDAYELWGEATDVQEWRFLIRCPEESTGSSDKQPSTKVEGQKPLLMEGGEGSLQHWKYYFILASLLLMLSNCRLYPYIRGYQIPMGKRITVHVCF
uniref:Uncharacterized protein n=1 Tax=Oryza sativa subsp. japonica TaxID=39947 RepID=Q84SN8_ORYSJ|nr:hypothetical protein [Oryza sativa Japonica Group]